MRRSRSAEETDPHAEHAPEGQVSSHAVLAFRIGPTLLGFEATRVGGVSPASRVWRVPGAPAAWLGLAEWRGRLITIVDLPLVLGRPVCASLARCFVPLAAPLERTAFSVPTPVRLAAARRGGAGAQASPLGELSAGSFEQDGEHGWLVDPRAVLRLLQRSLAASLRTPPARRGGAA